MEVELKHTSAIYRIAQHGDFDGTADLTNGCSFICSFVLGIVGRFKMESQFAGGGNE